MITPKMACKLALELPDVTEKPHFDSAGFYAHKRIFATVWHDEKEVNVRLNPDAQETFVKRDSKAFVEIDNGWGRQGWTTIRLKFVSKDLFKDALRVAWELSAKKRSRS